MATRTWSAGAAGNWSTAANWSGSIVPENGDAVVFDTSSFGCTVDVATNSLLSFTMTINYGGALTINNQINVAGNIAINTGGGIGGSAAFNETATSTISSNVNLPALIVNASGLTSTLASALTITGALTVTAGTLSTSASSYALTCSGNAILNGTLTGNGSTIYLGSLTIGATGAYSATSSETRITSNDGTNVISNSGTFTHNSGTVQITNETTGRNIAGTIAFNNVTINGAVATTITLTGNCSFAGTLTVTLGILAMGATTQTVQNLTIGGANGSMTVGTGGSLTINGTTTITGGSLGSAVAYTLDMNGNLATSTGTLSAPTLTGTFTFSGTTWNTPTTFTHNSGRVTFDGASSLGNDSTQFNRVTISPGASLDTTATPYDLTTAAYLIVNGTLTTNTSVITVNGGGISVDSTGSFGSANSAYTLDCNGIFTPIFGCTFQAPNASGSFTLSGNPNLGTPESGFTHNNGTVTIDGTVVMGSKWTKLNNLTIDATKSFSTSASNYQLTCAGNVVVNGTLTGNSATQSYGSMTISATGTYNTFGAITITSKDGSSNAWSNGGIFTANTCTVDFTGQSGTYKILGNNSWYTLTITTTAACAYNFEVAHTQTITNSVTLTGAGGQRLTLNSDTGAADWLFTIQAGKTQSVSYVSVTHSDASGGDEVNASDGTSINNGNNTNWNFGADVGEATMGMDIKRRGRRLQRKR